MAYNFHEYENFIKIPLLLKIYLKKHKMFKICLELESLANKANRRVTENANVFTLHLAS